MVIHCCLHQPCSCIKHSSDMPLTEMWHLGVRWWWVHNSEYGEINSSVGLFVKMSPWKNQRASLEHFKRVRGGDEDGGEVSHHIDISKLGLKMLTMSLKFEGENANLVTTHQQNVHIYYFEKIYNKQASSNNNKGRKKDFPYFRRHSILLI